MRPRMIFPVFLTFLLMQAYAGFGQIIKTQAWILYEQGNASFASKEYGVALAKYQGALAAFYPFPEAEAGIGDVYVQEGELELAVRQYRKAYELKNSLYIPETRYEILYKLARIYEVKLEYKSFEDSLKAVLVDDKNYTPTGTSRLREQFESNYYAKGLDFTLKLYRFPERFSADAHSKLGWFYYRSGNYTVSVVHLLYALVYKIGDASQFVLENDTDFQFTTLSDFLKIADGDKAVLAYLEKTDVYKDLYYLAGSTFKAGYPAHAKMIWQILSKSARAGTYTDLSTRQLKSPWTEPLLAQPQGKK
jgi:tetratricopeptide (TPR) repeat protein